MSTLLIAGGDGATLSENDGPLFDLDFDLEAEAEMEMEGDAKDDPSKGMEKNGEEDIGTDNDGNELDDGSYDESEQSIDSDQEREEAVREGFLWFFVDKLGCAVLAPLLEALDSFLKSIQDYFMSIFDRLMRCFRGNDEPADAQDLVTEVADAMDPSSALDSSKFLTHTNSATGFGGGPTGLENSAVGFGGGPIGTPGVAEMAASAAQGAATSSASGVAASASVAGASAAGLSGATTLVGAVAASSLATQAGVAVGATLTVAAVSAGVLQSTSSAPTPTPTPETQFPTVFEHFVPPVCSDAEKMEVGFVELQIKGIPPDLLFNQQDRQMMEFLFRDAYNDISGMCLDLYDRVMHNVTIDKWETDWGNFTSSDTLSFLPPDFGSLDLGNSSTVGRIGSSKGNQTSQSDPLISWLQDSNTTLDEYNELVADSITTVVWKASVACNGCPDYEPLFQLATEDNTSARTRRTLSNLHAHRNLVMHGLNLEMSEFLPLHAASFGFNMQTALSNTAGCSTIQKKVEHHPSASCLCDHTSQQTARL